MSAESSDYVPSEEEEDVASCSEIDASSGSGDEAVSSGTGSDDEASRRPAPASRTTTRRSTRAAAGGLGSRGGRSRRSKPADSESAESHGNDSAEVSSEESDEPVARRRGRRSTPAAALGSSSNTSRSRRPKASGSGVAESSGSAPAEASPAESDEPAPRRRGRKHPAPEATHTPVDRPRRTAGRGIKAGRSEGSGRDGGSDAAPCGSGVVGAAASGGLACGRGGVVARGGVTEGGVAGGRDDDTEGGGGGARGRVGRVRRIVIDDEDESGSGEGGEAGGGRAASDLGPRGCDTAGGGVGGRLRRGGEGKELPSPAAAVRAATAQWRESRRASGPPQVQSAGCEASGPPPISGRAGASGAGRRGGGRAGDGTCSEDGENTDGDGEASSGDDRSDLNGEKGQDAITGDLLLTDYVVWRSPDGSTVMRMNISTMRKIALGAGQWKQPPHFRAPMEDNLRRQIVRKWGERSLTLPTDNVGQPDARFQDDFERYHARKLSHIHNLFCCPICMLWLRLDSAAEAQRCAESGLLDANIDGRFGQSDADELRAYQVLEAADAAWGDREVFRSQLAKQPNGDMQDEEAEEAMCGELLETPCEPLTVLYFSTPVRDWERDNLFTLPPEVAAAQCTVRTLAQLRAHLTSTHKLPKTVLRAPLVNERLKQYQLRQQDGLVMRWVHARRREYGAGGNAAQLYWHRPARHMSTCHAALYCSLYDEVESRDLELGRRRASTAPASFAPLFEHRLSDPSASRLAWARLGLGGAGSESEGEDVDDFIAGESEGDSDAGGGEESEGESGEEGESGSGSEEKEGEGEMAEEEAAEAAAAARARVLRERKALRMAASGGLGSAGLGSAGEDVLEPSTPKRLRKGGWDGKGVWGGEEEGEDGEEGEEAAVEFLVEPDALDQAEAALRRKRQAEKRARGRTPSRGMGRRGAASVAASGEGASVADGAAVGAGSKRARVIVVSDEEED